MMQKFRQEMYSTPKDAMNFMEHLSREPGMFAEYTLDDHGRLVNIFWATADQQEKMARFAGCIQMDTTIFTNRSILTVIKKV